MAMFRQHIALGTIITAAGVAAVFFYGLLTDPLLLIIFFTLGTVGSFLPDVDSDSGLPFYLMFGLATVGFGGAAVYYELMHGTANPYVLVGVPLAALAFFWFVIGSVFKQCTHHRGIWHSIPALGIASLCVYIASVYLGVDQQSAMVLAAAMAGGFLSHLVLDEFVSEVNFDGIPFIPKRSLGTALKLFSLSHKVNFLTYMILFTLVYVALHPIVRG
jgi:hypothetical protein